MNSVTIAFVVRTSFEMFQADSSDIVYTGSQITTHIQKLTNLSLNANTLRYKGKPVPTKTIMEEFN